MVYVVVNLAFVPAVHFIIMGKLIICWIVLFFLLTFFSLLTSAQ